MPRPTKRSFSIKGHRTSLSLEEPFWRALTAAAQQRGQTVAGLVTDIDALRDQDTGLSGAVRVYLLEHFRSQADD